MLGWPRFSAAQPNPGHRALVTLERRGLVTGVITQNVDRLHHAAGSSNVIELHGALAEVRCLRCDERESRAQLQTRLLQLNPQLAHAQAALAPDGDADLAARWLADFRVAGCLACDGVLKPNVVFFGESVPRATVEAAYSLVDAADALLVIGSSLAVFSGYRFVKRAHEQHKPLAIMTIGETRGDALAQVRVQLRIGEALPALADGLLGGAITKR